VGGGKCQIRVGASGWYYEHWRGRFYPQGLNKSQWFGFYAENFDTVEINSTFYHQPKEANLKRWYELSPAEFVFAVKANRYITHIKRLKDVSDEIGRLEQAVGILKEKAGPVLYQLPPSMHKDIGLLEGFLGLLDRKRPAVFEFRHQSWFSDDCYELLDKWGKGFCIEDMPGAVSPRVITGGLVYIRFHGAVSRYESRYPKQQIADWAGWIKQHIPPTNTAGKKRVESVWAYFNNDANANAVHNARELRAELQYGAESF
jgi:uncharacterized protein YecE (DUF72 family)